MLSQVFYLIRSKQDGQYLVARPTRSTPPENPDQPDPGFILMFREHFDALSYLNTHGASVADQFAVESIPGSQLNGLMKRWGFTGMGIVTDPLMPDIEFFLQG